MAKKIFSKDNSSYFLVIIAYILVELLLKTGSLSSLMRGLLVPLCVYVILAVSLNITVGILGELSLGHAGFMCVGAFAGAFMSRYIGDSLPQGAVFLIALLTGAIVASVFGIIIGIPVLRLKGDYLAIVTLAFGEIIKNIMNILYVGKDANGLHISLNSASSLGLDPESGDIIINGAMGITGTPKSSTFTIGIILVLLTLFVTLNLIHSRTGRGAINRHKHHKIQASCFHRFGSLRRHRRRTLCPQPQHTYGAAKKLRLQYVYNDTRICRSWRYGQHKRLHYSRRGAYAAA